MLNFTSESRYELAEKVKDGTYKSRRIHILFSHCYYPPRGEHSTIPEPRFFFTRHALSKASSSTNNRQRLCRSCWNWFSCYANQFQNKSHPTCFTCMISTKWIKMVSSVPGLLRTSSSKGEEHFGCCFFRPGNLGLFDVSFERVRVLKKTTST